MFVNQQQHILCAIRERNDKSSRPKMLQFDLRPHRYCFIHTSRAPVSTVRGERTLKRTDSRVSHFKRFILAVLKMKYTMNYVRTPSSLSSDTFCCRFHWTTREKKPTSTFTSWIQISTSDHDSVQFQLPLPIMYFIETNGQGFILPRCHSAVRLLRQFESVILFPSILAKNSALTHSIKKYRYPAVTVR